jgi:hypothetical protein
VPSGEPPARHITSSFSKAQSRRSLCKHSNLVAPSLHHPLSSLDLAKKVFPRSEQRPPAMKLQTWLVFGNDKQYLECSGSTRMKASILSLVQRLSTLRRRSRSGLIFPNKLVDSTSRETCQPLTVIGRLVFENRAPEHVDYAHLCPLSLNGRLLINSMQSLLWIDS